jgi:hypothetical protein
MAQTDAVTLIHRFGSALNLNILCGTPHKNFHVLFLDRLYVECAAGSVRFRWVKTPMSNDRGRKKLPFVAHQGMAAVGRDLLKEVREAGPFSHGVAN